MENYRRVRGSRNALPQLEPNEVAIMTHSNPAETAAKCLEIIQGGSPVVLKAIGQAVGRAIAIGARHG